MFRDVVKGYFFNVIVRYIFVCFLDVGQGSEGNGFQAFGDFEKQIYDGVLRGEGTVKGVDRFLMQRD